MKQPLVFVCCIVLLIQAKAQSNGNHQPDSAGTVQIQKMHFPVAVLSDEVKTSAAITKLAGQLITIYTEKNKGTYFSTIADLHSLTSNYTQALLMLDSADMITSDKSKTIYSRSYTLAKIKAANDPAAFDKIFQKEFESIFNGLSFNKKVYAAFVDSSALKSLKERYSKLVEKIKTNKTDSISTEDAVKLCNNYFDYTVTNSTFSFAQPYTADPKYKRYYPVIKGAGWTGVYPVNNVDELPDPKMKYKLLIELVNFGPKDPDSSISKNVNFGLVEVGRLINLHVANGIPKENLDIVIVVHASALRAFLNNDEYKKKYGVDNPNIAFLKQMESVGVKLLACGQAILFLGLEKEHMLPDVKVVLTAQTVLTSYQLKGYVLKKITLDE